MKTSPVLDKRAACAKADPDIFHAPRRDRRGQQAAKQICCGCPIREACLEWQLEFERGLSAGAREGIFAGLDPAERVTEQDRRYPDQKTYRRGTNAYKEMAS